MAKNLQIGIVFLIGIIFLLTGLVWADTNGVWHRAEDVQGGIFGSDEQGVTSGYSFINRVVFNSETLFNDYVQINSDLNVSGNIRTGGNLVATLDSSGKVPISQLPFHKGDLISPLNRLLLSGLANYDTDYFDITNLGISGLNAANVKSGVSFGLGNSFTGTFTSDGTATSSKIVSGHTAYVNGVKVTGTLGIDSICSSAGGSANCGVSTSSLSPGTFYALIGSNSATGTSYCSKVDVSVTGSVSSTIVQSAGLCELISSCSSSSQSVDNYPDLTSCGGSNVCQGGGCYSYSWQVGSYGACSVSCGGGVQSRSVTCLRNDGVIVGDSFCINAGAKPLTSQSCNTLSCSFWMPVQGPPTGLSYGWYAYGISGGGGSNCKTHTVCGLPTTAMTVSEYVKWYDHGFYTTSQTRSKPAGTTCHTSATYCIHQGGYIKYYFS